MRLASVIALSLAPLALGACATTQQEAVRLQLNSARLRSGEQPLRVGQRTHAVAVERVELFTDRAGSAVLVRLRNTTRAPVSDLPIAVGVVTRPGSRRALNGATGLDYFDTHIPAIAPGCELSWVFTTDRTLAPRWRPYAEVGTQALTKPKSLPSLTVTARQRTGGQLNVTVRNATSVPQYQLQVYAVARSGERIVAAGRASIAHLGTNATTQLALKLVGGRASGAQLSLQAPPTIFG